MQHRLIVTLTAGLFFIVAADAQGHMAFKKELSKKYPDMKISCNACHVKSKPKTERNEFGKLFHKELKEKNLTEQWKSTEKSERKQFEKDVMVPAFTKALEKIKKMKKKETEITYDELIKAGEIDEIKPKAG